MIFRTTWAGSLEKIRDEVRQLQKDVVSLAASFQAVWVWLSGETIDSDIFRGKKRPVKTSGSSLILADWCSSWWSQDERPVPRQKRLWSNTMSISQVLLSAKLLDDQMTTDYWGLLLCGAWLRLTLETRSRPCELQFRAMEFLVFRWEPQWTLGEMVANTFYILPRLPSVSVKDCNLLPILSWLITCSLRNAFGLAFPIKLIL